MASFREVLKRLFTRNIVIKKLPNGNLKVIDFNKSQSVGSPTQYQNKPRWRNARNFNAISGYGTGYAKEEIEALRKQMYQDYDIMDTDAIVSSVLDIITDECTNNSENGELLVINTSNSNLKQILHNLFYDILNIEFNLWQWVRTANKYGDNFLYLQIAEGAGIVSVMPVHPLLIIREEGSKEEPDQVRFKYEGMYGVSGFAVNNYFEEYEMVHFRLLGDVNFLPYGRSYVEGGRQEFKRMRLAEDALLLNRIMRAPERRLFKIDVGNIAPEEVDAYMEQIVNETKKIPYIDPVTGDFNLKYNIQPVAWYSKIPLLDGRTITIKELSEELKSGNEVWVYSIDTERVAIVPGLVTWCDLTQKDAQILRVYLDDESYIDVEPNHPFMLRDGTYIKSKDLKEGMALMPLFTKLSDNKNIKNYELVYNPQDEKYDFTHRIVARELNIDGYNDTKNVVHHKNFRKENNSPSNLDCSMTFKEHIGFHYKVASEMWADKTDDEKEEINRRRSETHKKNFEDGIVQIWSTGLTKYTDERVRLNGLKQTKENNPERARKISEHHTGIKRPEHSKWMKENFIPYKRTDEHRKNLSELMSGENNPNFGKTWEERFGEERAKELKEKNIELQQKLRTLANYSQSEVGRQKKSKFMSLENQRRWKDDEFNQRVSDSMKDRFDDYLFNVMISIIKENPTITCLKMIDHMNNIHGLYDYYLKLNEGRKKPNEFKLHSIQRAIIRNGFESYPDFREKITQSEYKNHKVLRLEYLSNTDDVYCMTVDKYHNFAIDSHNGISRNGIFVKNSSLEDFYMPVRGSDSGTTIETLPGLTNDGMLEDVKYFKNKMLAAFKVPKEYIDYTDEEGSGADKSSLSQKDIRFARTIERIQKIIVSELYKIALIHLKVQGFENTELLDFELILTNPSLIFERQKTDILTAKIDLAKSATEPESRILSKVRLWKNIFGLTDDEIEELKLQQIEDAKFEFRLKQVAEEGNDPEVTGKSYGTAHDIASMQVASKFTPGQYGESNKHLYSKDEREENKGKPDQYKGSFETVRDQDFGRDPVGRREINKLEGYQRLLKKLDQLKPSKKQNHIMLSEEILLKDDDNYK